MLTAERHYAHANSARPFAPIGIGLTLFVGMLYVKQSTKEVSSDLINTLQLDDCLDRRFTQHR